MVLGKVWDGAVEMHQHLALAQHFPAFHHHYPTVGRLLFLMVVQLPRWEGPVEDIQA